jgi:hypothetical protein
MQQQPQRRISPIEGLIVLGLVFWLLFMGGLSALKSSKVPSTIGTGLQRLVGTAAAAATERPISLTAPTSAVDTGSRSTGRDVRLPAPPARGAGGVGAGAGAGSNAPAQTGATTAPTAVPAPTATPMIAGGAPAAAPAEAPAALGYTVPAGQHTDIHPDGSFTIDNGNVRYYPNSDSVIVEVRIEGDYESNVAAEGAPPEQKTFLDQNNPTDAAYLANIPTATPSNSKSCGGRTRSCK